MSQLPPVVHEVTVGGSPEEVFEAFTAEVGQWWPLASHSLSSAVCSAPATTCAFEPRVGGSFVETMANGELCEWGEVLVWEPGRRVRFTWHLGRDLDNPTEVDVTFAPAGDGATRVRLEHSGWERLEDGAERRESYHAGWQGILAEQFVGHLTPAV